MDESCAFVSQSAKEKAKERYNRRCFKCKQTGHILAKSPFVISDRRPTRNQKKSEKHLAANTNFAASCLLIPKATNGDKDWFLDSVATTHLTHRDDWMEEYNGRTARTVAIANGRNISTKGCGVVKIPLATEKTMVAHDVRHAPELALNLLSVSRIAAQKKTLIFDEYVDIGVKVLREHFLGTAMQHNGLYQLYRRDHWTMAVQDIPDLRHCRPRHLSRRSMKPLQDGQATGIPSDAITKTDYATCLKGKQCRLPFSKLATKGSEDVLLAKSPFVISDRRPTRNQKKSEKHLAANTNFAASCLLIPKATNGDKDWFLDSVATTHLTHRDDWMEEYNGRTARTVAIANGRNISTKGCGVVKIPLATEKTMVAHDVRHAPELALNLLSVSRIAAQKKTLIFDEYVDIGVKVLREHFLGTAMQHNGLYQLYRREHWTMAVQDIPDLWHCRLGHLSRRSMKPLQDGQATGIPSDAITKTDCATCLKGKQCRLPFSKLATKGSEDVLELVHSGICGPMQVVSVGGDRYFLSFIDDFSRKSFVYFLKHKNEALPKFKDFIAVVERQTSKKNFWPEKAFVTIPETRQQNGVAERMNRTLVEKARTMLIDANLSPDLCVEAVGTANYLRNRCPTKTL
ncbi:Retrovirus-related Pol polyprotein from transposon TNT 1-94 [Trichinella nativa]|uniref:Retrovirus-related Pol polyprotein from transposon TNT 1-94 n=1 Tax=Trichinella nativa TaxID=6335 RepID=A0A0V1LVE4_9BILA|nr:Retrovirus-related Pol polyprotein from transposon TNT 1-94 [Trichinella nativa]